MIKTCVELISVKIFNKTDTIWVSSYDIYFKNSWKSLIMHDNVFVEVMWAQKFNKYFAEDSSPK